MAKNQILSVQGQQIRLTKLNEDDYISLSDIAKDFGGNDQIKNWIRTRRTVEFLGTWEVINNPGFNMVEFHQVTYESGSEKFIMSPTQWADRTSAVGIVAKSGRYGGGTFAHKDIAFEFCSWLSPQFKLYLILEFQRLKEAEQQASDPEWDVRRVLTKMNFRLQTDAVKNYIIPVVNPPEGKEWILYAEEADLLNMAVFHCRAKDWREMNPTLCLQGKNMRDYATINELTVISNLESMNSRLIKEGYTKPQRLQFLIEVATEQLESLSRVDYTEIIRTTKQPAPLQAKPASNIFEAGLKGLLSIPPPPKPEKRAKKNRPAADEETGESY